MPMPVENDQGHAQHCMRVTAAKRQGSPPLGLLRKQVHELLQGLRGWTCLLLRPSSLHRSQVVKLGFGLLQVQAAKGMWEAGR